MTWNKEVYKERRFSLANHYCRTHHAESTSDEQQVAAAAAVAAIHVESYFYDSRTLPLKTSTPTAS